MTSDPDPDHPLFVFGGPYSNLEASLAALDAAESLGLPPTNVICTGDVVAYAGAPDETATLIRTSGIQVIAGNCEEQLAEQADDCGCGFEAGTACDRLSRSWYAFANQRLSSQNRAWMRGLANTQRFTYAGRRFRVIHGGVERVNRFIFASERDVVVEEHARADADVVLCGHSGIPFLQAVRTADGHEGAWVNAGVIGVPANDATQDGWYALITPSDDGSLEIALKRLAYDATAAARAMRVHGHADGYADAIEIGVWPSLDILPDAERSAAARPLSEDRLTLSPIGADAREIAWLGAAAAS